MAKEIDFSVAPLETLEAPGLGLFWSIVAVVWGSIWLIASIVNGTAPVVPDPTPAPTGAV